MKTTARRTAAGLLLALLASPLRPCPSDPVEVARRTAEWRRQHELQILAEFRELLTLPNVSSDRVGIRRNAAALVQMLGRRGLVAERWSVQDSAPVIFAERPRENARWTLLFYAHYDGQPVDLDSWHSPPFEPTLRRGLREDGAAVLPWDKLTSPVDPELRVYARSAADDKAPILALLAALDALDTLEIPLAVHLKVLLEGEEEAGSTHLRAILAEHRDRWAADAMLLCDGPVHPSGQMQLVLGARGVVGLELTVYGPTRPLHSGHYGNFATNPAALLSHLLAGMRASDGTITIEGFAADVRPPAAAELEAIDQAPRLPRLLAELGISASEIPDERPESAVLRPALNIRGVQSGNTGTLARNAIPATARASIDFRLVPDQTPERVRERVEAHLRFQGFHLVEGEPDEATRALHPRLLSLEWGTGYPPARTAVDHPFCQELLGLTRAVRGAAVVVLPTLGGSVPIHLFQAPRALPVVIFPIVNHDNNQHAPDENLRIGHLMDGIDLFAAVLAGLGAR